MSPTTTEQCLLDLLAIPSVSGHEQRLIQFLEKRLQQTFTFTPIPVDTTRNALLCTTPGTLETLLVAHIDTVSGELPVFMDERAIHGRGSCDNKGAAAAMISAAFTAVERKKTNFGLLFTIGEETSFDGAKAAQAFFETHHIRPTNVIIGEPTHLEIITAQFGIFCFEIQCKGTAEHSSTLHPDSAIHKLVKILNTLLATPFIETTFHIGKIEGGEAENIVASTAKATLLFRSADANLEQKIQQCLASTDIPHNLNVLKRIAHIDNSTAKHPKRTVPFFTEMAFFKNSIVCGPGDIRLAHTPHENVPRDELNKATEIYTQFL